MFDFHGEKFKYPVKRASLRIKKKKAKRNVSLHVCYLVTCLEKEWIKKEAYSNSEFKTNDQLN